MVSWECPYESDLNEPYEKVPIKMIRIDEKWMNRVNRGEMSEWMEMTWNNPMGMVLWSSEGVPIKMTWVKVKINVPIKMNGIDEKWMNRVNRGEMSEWMEMTWNNPMGMVLWSVESVPIKVTGMNPMRMSLSKWMESMRNEWNEVNRGE